MSLSEFLLARIAEEESAWREGGALVTRPDFARFSRHMLADCEAKRRIVEHYLAGRENWGSIGINTTTAAMMGEREHAMRTLAAAYASHPDYWQEWALEEWVR